MTRSRLLLVDDSPDLIFILEQMLARHGYEHVVSTTDPSKAVDLFRAFRADLVLLDLHMPHMNGLDLIAGLLDAAGDDFLPIIMLTGDLTPEVRHRALRTGARDFITKPFDDSEVQLRIGNLLEMRHLHTDLKSQNQILERRVAERTRDLERAKKEILLRLARAAEFRDDATGRHTQRVGLVAGHIAAALEMPAKQVEIIREAAPLHDVGKIGVPDDVLLKAGPLSPSEWEVIKRHTVTGARLLANSVSQTLKVGEKIALTHHERWDGRGYEGLKGKQTPLCGRIVAVADAFDAMTHDRPYREALSRRDALTEIDACRGSHFDPEVVDAFLAAYDTIDHDLSGADITTAGSATL
ncbi:MAG TPA: HD domain-containing phosphohydrolase [Actinomycetota bacterium]|nr:HD domain-containing phosphohydrolase [Actinomycetota bacterium]